jgi:hypothetical protein
MDPDASNLLPWWSSPAGITFGFLVPMLMLIAYSGSSDLSGLTVRGISYLNAQYIALGILVLVVIGVSGWIGAQTRTTAVRNPPEDFVWNRAAVVVGGIALGAYVIFFKDFVLNPLLFLQTLIGAYRPDRKNIELTTGITSLVNCAPVFFSIYAFRVVYCRIPTQGYMHFLMFVLLCATALRVYAWSERLALIEATVPFGLAYASRLAAAKGSTARLAARGGPFLAIPGLIVYFAAAEYFRSWKSATYAGHSGFWEFAIGRFASYYYTSLNNGAGILTTADWPSFQFENTLMWLHRAPFVGRIFSYYVNLRVEENELFLWKYGDLEFNNPSGIYSVIYDLGLPLGLIYFAAIGIAAGVAFSRYRAKTVAGAFFYPILFLTLLEVFRYPYLGYSRGFTWVLGICLALVAGRPWLRRATPQFAVTGRMSS